MKRDPNAFTLVTDDPITLDLTGCIYPDDLHERIKKTFGFPEYYGKNWDAMWDCIHLLFDKREILVKGYETMPKDGQEYCKELFAILEDLHRENPNITYRMI